MDTSNNLRNLALAAHVDAGKTTLCERLLFDCQAISVMGNVDAGSAVMDYLPEEQKRGISICTAAISCFWHGLRLNLVDTPGHVDFTGEVERSLRAVDAAIVIVSAVDGVEAQTEAVWRSLDQRGLPRLVFINKCDRSESNYEAVLSELETRLGAKTALLTVPRFAEEDKASQAPSSLSGVLSLLNAKTIENADLRQKAESLRETLLERVAEADDTFLSLWLEGDFDEKDVVCALARATQAGRLVPVCSGSALKNLGIIELLNCASALLPAPAISQEDLQAPLQAYIFKVVWHGDQRFAFLRLLKGSLKNHDKLRLFGQSEPCEITLFRPDAERFLDLEQALAGDLVAITGIDAQAGAMLASQPSAAASNYQKYPTVLRQSLEPYQEADYAPLAEALTRIADEDPSLEIGRDAATGTYLVSGLGELHLEILRERLLREFGLEVRAQEPQVRHKESIRRGAQAEAHCEMDGQKGSVRLSVRPLDDCLKCQTAFSAQCTATKAEACAIDDALQTVLTAGVLAGWPLAGLGVEVLAIGPDLRSPDCLARAAREALIEAIQKAQPILLSPLMHLELTAPESCLGPALHLLQSLNVRILSLEALAKGTSLCERRKRIVAEAFLEQLKNFSTRLRSTTGGRCQLLVRPERFAAFPDHE
ncbi:MAG: GTP-binding protein [Desulfovibrio sp.]|nr:GTP-binding protein [Desulfovibrio sp.]